MDKMEGLRAGAAEMRSVAQKLMAWADDLEASLGRVADTEASAVPVLSLPEVRSVLAEKCAAGYGTQVKALIESFGAASLREVPAEKYGELLAAVGLLGEGDMDAG